MSTLRSLLAISGLVASLTLTVAAEAAFDIRVEFYDADDKLMEETTTVHGLAGAVPGYEFVHSWVVPIDEGAGAPGRGRARLETLSVRIPIGRVSTRLRGLMATNERLRRVVFGFFAPAPDGTIEEFYRVTTHEVALVSMSAQFLDNRIPEYASVPVTEVVELAYENVEIDGGGVIVERLRFLRGDTNDDLGIDISDAVRLLAALFRGGRLSCPVAGDMNGDNQLDISDPTYLLNFLFRDGPPIPSPRVCADVPPGAACDATACGKAAP